MPCKLTACLAVGLCLALTVTRAQTVDSTIDKVTNFPTKIFNRITGKTADLQQQLQRQTVKYLQRMAREEQKLKARLYKQDSAKAATLYAQDPQQQYTLMIQKLQQDSSRVFSSMGPEYLAHVDSLQGALAFLNANPSVLGVSINSNPALIMKMQGSLAQVQQLQAKLQYADVIKQFVQSRKNQIQQVLGQFSHLPAGVTGPFAAYKSQAYYYAAQIRAYRQELNDPDKMMQTALVLLNKLPAFSSFMQKNSFLAGLFGVPAGYGTEQGLVGMQTREQVLAMVQSKIGSGGPGAASAIQSNLSKASQDISKLQSKLSALGAGSGGMDVPDFKPNDQKTKTFLKRLEYGVNFQTIPANSYFPSYSDLGLSLGYNLGHSNVIGVGASYKMGLGTPPEHVAISSQGLGLRSFINIKIKSSWSASGGFEYNYLQPFSRFQDLRVLNMWTRSGLIGITKTISLKSTVFKKTQVSFLWDFLSYSNVPQTPPILFRVGYAF
jgi:hypothetical protein